MIWINEGLSYTQFEYSKIMVQNNTKEGGVNISLDIKNVGNMDGEEVVQVYLKFPNDSAIKRLRGFKRIGLDKGEIKSVAIQIPADDMTIWNETNKKFELPKGKMKIMVGSSSSNIRLSKNILFD